MKKFSILIAIIAVVAMLSTVAFAAESALDFGEATKVVCSADEAGATVTVSVYSTIAKTIGQGGYFNLKYDTSAWAYTTYTAESYSDLEVYKDTEYITITLNPYANADVTVGGKIGDFVFTATGTKSVAGTSFILLDNEDAWTDASYIPIAYSGTIPVEVAAAKTPASVEAGTVAMKTLNGSTGVYNNVWTNSYTVKPGDDTIATLTLNFGSGKTYPVDTAVLSGGGNVVVKVAVVGAPSTATATLDFTVAQ